eukprot:SAG11_NODE_4067_length_2081_cov_1.993946_4_plen_205_part_00
MRKFGRKPCSVLVVERGCDAELGAAEQMRYSDNTAVASSPSRALPTASATAFSSMPKVTIGDVCPASCGRSCSGGSDGACAAGGRLLPLAELPTGGAYVESLAAFRAGYDEGWYTIGFVDGALKFLTLRLLSTTEKNQPQSFVVPVYDTFMALLDELNAACAAALRPRPLLARTRGLLSGLASPRSHDATTMNLLRSALRYSEF